MADSGFSGEEPNPACYIQQRANPLDRAALITMQYQLLGRGLPLACGAIGMTVFSSCTQDSGVKVYNTAPAISITAPLDGTEVDEG